MTVGDIILSARDLFPDVTATADADGLQVSAATCYRWLNEALKLCAQASNGIRSETGIGSVTGQPLYTFNGYWREITDCWYDGYTVNLVQHREIFYHNSVTGISALTTLSEGSNVQIVEMWPQPPRTSGQTTTSAPISTTTTTIPVASTGGFVLPFGLAMVGSEIVNYQGFTPTTLYGCTRGLGGTVAASTSTGAAVTELNIRFAGRRMPPSYGAGDAGLVIAIPMEWESLLTDWMLARFRESEAQRQEAASLKKEFIQASATLGNQDQVLVGPQQLGSGVSGRETFYGSVSGGIIVP